MHVSTHTDARRRGGAFLPRVAHHRGTTSGSFQSGSVWVAGCLGSAGAGTSGVECPDREKRFPPPSQKRKKRKKEKNEKQKCFLGHILVACRTQVQCGRNEKQKIHKALTEKNQSTICVQAGFCTCCHPSVFSSHPSLAMRVATQDLSAGSFSEENWI